MSQAERQGDTLEGQRPTVTPIELDGKVTEEWRGGWPRYSIGGEDMVHLLSDLAGHKVRIVIEIEDDAHSASL